MDLAEVVVTERVIPEADPTFNDLLRAGYQPEQIITCYPCKCKMEGRPVKDCAFPLNRKSDDKAST